jgi:hypothetical protein
MGGDEKPLVAVCKCAFAFLLHWKSFRAFEAEAAEMLIEYSS